MISLYHCVCTYVHVWHTWHLRHMCIGLFCTICGLWHEYGGEMLNNLRNSSRRQEVKLSLCSGMWAAASIITRCVHITRLLPQVKITERLESIYTMEAERPRRLQQSKAATDFSKSVINGESAAVWNSSVVSGGPKWSPSVWHYECFKYQTAVVFLVLGSSLNVGYYLYWKLNQ